MNFNKLQILEFKLKQMSEHPAIVMIAKRASGKSWVTRDIIYFFRHLPCGAIIAPTDRLNSFYKFFFPDLYIHYDITETIFTKIIGRQIMIKAECKERIKQGKKPISTSTIIVMDDCLADKKKWEKMQPITELLMNGRHYDITYILTMQTPLGIHPELRLNFDYIFLLKEDSGINLKKLHMNYASVFKTQSAFEQVFEKCTENFKSMVVNNRANTTNIQDKVFWFKAKERKFRFGSKQFREMSKKYFDPNYLVKCTKKILQGDYGGRKKGVDIKVDLKKK